MAKLNHRKYELLDHIIQAVNESDWNVLYTGNISQHPFLLKIYREDESHLLRIYIWNLTHGGGNARPVDEYRIQITGVAHFEQQENEKTLILGWWDQAGVFAGFDFNKHNGRLGTSPSIQIREKNLRDALINGFSACDRGNGEIAIAFRPDFLGEYVKDLKNLHQLGESLREVQVVEQIATGQLQVNSEEVKSLSEERQTTIEMINKKLRDNSFKKRVLTAYGNQCAFSGMQLKLIDAAHIFPVSEPTSTDDTSNGIALSALYHRAFDRGLVTLNELYQIIINETKVNKLKEVGLDGGMDVFRKNLRPVIIVPPAVSDRPNVNFVRDANILRGWEL
jgi:putative restriction endonuclease